MGGSHFNGERTMPGRPSGGPAGPVPVPEGRYSIAGGEEGKRRLDVLAAVMHQNTVALLNAVGVPSGARCLDVGCGGGHVARELARLAGPAGAVLGLDRDPVVLALARADTAAAGVSTVTFLEADVRALGEVAGPRGPFAVAYARFLLSHVPRPEEIIGAMAALLAPGGAVVLEDIDLSGSFCHPESQAHRRNCELYRETVCRRGGDADLGPRLPELLIQAGLGEVGVRVAQPVALTGDAKRLPLLTLERIVPAVIAEGLASAAELEALCADLRAFTADPTTLISVPRIVQAWGHRVPARR